ncbi:hypothetical protein FZEAL_7548 [Fusarium zealandicum]|uniref:C2H2-type domain-containing protein n=1 Tax=Fusarium zealandicum TaxID=1053134 RepID=A0A8H4UFH9_9HYPO|nr:hypothetical protein FZEAL_7548 [Fusarium zealandicum]
MSSHEDPSPAKIKRSTFSPWSSGVMSSKPPKKDVRGPEPARVVSDILEGAAVKPSAAAGGLANSAKIMALQKEWERNGRAGQSISRPSSTEPPSALPSLKPAVNQRKRESPASDTPTAKRQDTTERGPSPNSAAGENTQGASSQVRAGARRFTEAEVMKAMNDLTGAPVKKMAMAPPTMTAGTAFTPQSSQSMHFPTGGELLKKIMTSQGSQSPSPTPVSASPRADAAAQPPGSPAPGDRIMAIQMAEPNRSYSMYPSPDGGTVSGRGVLIPANYKLHDNPDLPYICPVRDCRRLFAGLKGLGGHFSAGHCSTTFNDNEDGTLSRVGNYVKHGPGGSPGIVVSKSPLPADAPPLADPGLSVFAMTHKRPTNIVMMDNAERRESARLHAVSGKDTPFFEPRVDMKEYLHSFLSPMQKTHQREDVTIMLGLSRKRELPEAWIQCHRGGNLDVNHYACALAFLSGREVTGKEQCMANSRYNSRPSARLSHPCISLIPGMPAVAKQAFSSVETCVGCRYWSHLQRRANGCDWSPDPKGGRGVSNGSVRSGSGSEDRPEAMEVDDKAQPENQPVVETVTETLPEPRRTRRPVPAQDILPEQDIVKEQPVVDVVGRLEQMGGVELEMEEWEVAPGRMRDESSSENLAYSNSYLTSGQPVTVSEDVSFNVLVVKPGSISHWNVEDEKLRTCSIAAGKVRVTTGDQTFQLGPNGMFVVRPGQTCKVENRLYLDSVVHCTTIGDFSLR